MEYIESPIKPSRTAPCWTCNSGWRFYERDVEFAPASLLGSPEQPKEKFWITCEKCSTRINVTGILTPKMRDNIRTGDLP